MLKLRSTIGNSTHPLGKDQLTPSTGDSALVDIAELELVHQPPISGAIYCILKTARVRGYFLMWLLLDSKLRHWCWLMPQSKLFYLMRCSNNTRIWWTCVFPWNTLLLRQSSSLRQDPHRPSTSPRLAAHDKAGTCKQAPGQKEPALGTQDIIIMNNHKPREALQHTEVEHEPDKVIPTSLTLDEKFINFHLLRWKTARK